VRLCEISDASAAIGVHSHLTGLGIPSVIVPFGDTAYPGATDTHRAYGEVRVDEEDLDRAKTALDEWNSASVEDFEIQWGQTHAMGFSAKNRVPSPYLAALFSLILPGAGQAYAGDVVQGVVGVILAVLCWKTFGPSMWYLLYAGLVSWLAFAKTHAHARDRSQNDAPSTSVNEVTEADD